MTFSSCRRLVASKGTFLESEQSFLTDVVVKSYLTRFKQTETHEGKAT